MGDGLGQSAVGLSRIRRPGRRPPPGPVSQQCPKTRSNGTDHVAQVRRPEPSEQRKCDAVRRRMTPLGTLGVKWSQVQILSARLRELPVRRRFFTSDRVGSLAWPPFQPSSELSAFPCAAVRAVTRRLPNPLSKSRAGSCRPNRRRACRNWVPCAWEQIDDMATNVRRERPPGRRPACPCGAPEHAPSGSYRKPRTARADPAGASARRVSVDLPRHGGE